MRACASRARSHRGRAEIADIEVHIQFNAGPSQVGTLTEIGHSRTASTPPLAMRRCSCGVSPSPCAVSARFQPNRLIVISLANDYDSGEHQLRNRSYAAALYGNDCSCLSVLARPARGVWPLTKRTIGGRSIVAQPSH